MLSTIHKSIVYLRSIGIIHKQQDIADAMGMDKSRESEALRRKEGKLNDHFINRFADTFSEHIHKEWLLTEEGEMKKNFRLNIPGRLPEQYLNLVNMVVEDNKNHRPHIDAKASAGFMDGLSDGDYGDDTLFYHKLTDRLNPPIALIRQGARL